MTTVFDLDQVTRGDLIEQAIRPMAGSRKRRQHARLRYLLMREEYDSLVRSWVDEVYQTPDIVDQIVKHVLPLYNPLKRASDRLAVAYKLLPRRGLAKASKTLNRAWLDFLRGIDYDTHWQMWNRYTVAMNAICILPWPAKTSDGDVTFTFRMVTGAIAEVYQDQDLAMAQPPTVLAYQCVDPVRLWSVAAAAADVPVVKTVDDQYVVEWSFDKKPLRIIEHGLGTFPGVVARNTLPDDDFWDPWPNKHAVQVSKTVTRIVAEMNWERTSKRGKQVILTLNEEGQEGTGIEGMTMADPEQVWRFRGDAAKVEALDLSVLVGPFKDHIEMIQDESLEQMTGAVARVVDPDPKNPVVGEMAARQHAAINMHRIQQVGFLQRADLRLQYVLAKMAKAYDIPNAVDPEKVKESATIEYVEVPMSQDPMQWLNWHMTATKFGISDPIEARREKTGETREEAKKVLMEMQKDRAEFYDVLARTNTPADANHAEPDSAQMGERPEAATGRYGGRARPERGDGATA